MSIAPNILISAIIMYILSRSMLKLWWVIKNNFLYTKLYFTIIICTLSHFGIKKQKFYTILQCLKLYTTPLSHTRLWVGCLLLSKDLMTSEHNTLLQLSHVYDYVYHPHLKRQTVNCINEYKGLHHFLFSASWILSVTHSATYTLPSSLLLFVHRQCCLPSNISVT